MVSINLEDVYLQIPIHPSSCKYLRFTAGGMAWQFKVLCFGLSMAPQVFTRVMAPVSGFLHQPGVWMLQYLDDWLILASSRKEACWARVKVLSLCQDLGIVVNLDKSSLALSQSGDQDRVADFPGFADSLEDRKVLLRVATRKKQACFFRKKTFFFAKKTQLEKNRSKFCFFHF